MDHFAGLDVSVKETSVCIVDDTGRIVREVKVASEPEALLTALKNPSYHFKRIGLEAGPLSQWLFSALAEAELPVVCVETRHMQAVLKAQINKTDRNDARGIAQMMRMGLYRPVHVKTLRSQKLRMMLTHRKLLQSKAIAIENDLRGTLRNFGLKVGIAGKTKFEARIKELVENLPDLAELVEPMLVVRRTLREQIVILHRRLLAIVRDDEVCRRLMTTPGVGPVVALTYRATVDVPARFCKSKSVGAVFGLTCSKYQSGEIDRSGRISRCGDEMMRVMLYEGSAAALADRTAIARDPAPILEIVNGSKRRPASRRQRTAFSAQPATGRRSARSFLHAASLTRRGGNTAPRRRKGSMPKVGRAHKRDVKGSTVTRPKILWSRSFRNGARRSRRNAAAPFRRLLAHLETSWTVCLSGEAVADSSLVHNQRGALRIGFDLAAQGMDERVQGLAIAPGVGAPEAGEDFVEGRHPARVPRKSCEDALFRA